MRSSSSLLGHDAYTFCPFHMLSIFTTSSHAVVGFVWTNSATRKECPSHIRSQRWVSAGSEFWHYGAS